MLRISFVFPYDKIQLGLLINCLSIAPAGGWSGENVTVTMFDVLATSQVAPVGLFILSATTVPDFPAGANHSKVSLGRNGLRTKKGYRELI